MTTGVWRHVAHNLSLCYAVVNIFYEFVDQLDDDELRNSYFQQDGATARNTNESVTEIESIWWPDNFERIMASKISWLKPAIFFCGAP